MEQSINAASDIKKEETCLKRTLAPEQLIFTKFIGGTQKHVDHYMIQVCLRSSAPLDDDEQ